MLEKMKTNNTISVVPVEDGDFKDYDQFLNSIYTKIESGQVSKNHIFSVEEDVAPTTLSIRCDDLEGSETLCQRMVKKGTGGLDRINKLKHPRLLNIPPPAGVPAIKQVELYKKYRPLIPKKWQDITCPHPGEEILNAIKTERNEKQRKRQKDKRVKNSHEQQTIEIHAANGEGGGVMEE